MLSLWLVFHAVGGGTGYGGIGHGVVELDSDAPIVFGSAALGTGLSDGRFFFLVN